MKLYQFIAQRIAQLRNLTDTSFMPDDIREKREEMAAHVEDSLHQLVKERFPSGSGFDAGTKLHLDTATPNRYVFQADFHHMDDNGYYCGWSHHTVVVTPDMQFGFRIRVTGRDMRDIKGYIAEMFDHVLNCDEDFKFTLT